MLSGGKNRQ